MFIDILEELAIKVNVGGFALNEEKMDESITDNLFIPYSLPLIEVLNLDFRLTLEMKHQNDFQKVNFY